MTLVHQSGIDMNHDVGASCILATNLIFWQDEDTSLLWKFSQGPANRCRNRRVAWSHVGERDLVRKENALKVLFTLAISARWTALSRFSTCEGGRRDWLVVRLACVSFLSLLGSLVNKKPKIETQSKRSPGVSNMVAILPCPNSRAHKGGPASSSTNQFANHLSPQTLQKTNYIEKSSMNLSEFLTLLFMTTPSETKLSALPIKISGTRKNMTNPSTLVFFLFQKTFLGRVRVK